MEACSILRIQQAFTSDHTPQGKADPERVRRPLKEECLWLNEWPSPFELSRALEAWITDSNAHDLHSSLGYRTPRQWERDDHSSHSSPFVAA
jgi:transposase InsO family protein